MLEIELTVEITLDFGPVDPHFQIVPLPARGGRIANPFHRRSFSLFEFPEHQIVFETIRSNGQIVAVGLEVEQNSCTLVDAA